VFGQSWLTVADAGLKFTALETRQRFPVYLFVIVEIGFDIHRQVDVEGRIAILVEQFGPS
jgi:hypothetical protein